MGFLDRLRGVFGKGGEDDGTTDEESGHRDESEPTADGGLGAAATTPDEFEEIDDDLEPPESYRERAENFAESWGSRGLDFTPDSLSRLDDLVDSQWDKDRFSDDGDDEELNVDSLVYKGVTEQLGSYFGETLVRTYDDAEWREERTGWVVVVDGPDTEAIVEPFELAGECLQEPSKFDRRHRALASHTGVGS